MNLVPKFHHDCDACIFLGTYTTAWTRESRPDLAEYPERYEPRTADLYACCVGGPLKQTRVSTYIARWSDDGPDYTSGLEFSAPYIGFPGNKIMPGNLWLVEARRRYESR